jgi:hypothetical protein
VPRVRLHISTPSHFKCGSAGRFRRKWPKEKHKERRGCMHFFLTHCLIFAATSPPFFSPSPPPFVPMQDCVVAGYVLSYHLRLFPFSSFPPAP